MKQTFDGYHGEWNLGSPGGWEYQGMIKEIYLPGWKKIKQLTGIEVELDLENSLFHPSLKFAQLLLEHSKKQFPNKEPFIAIAAEEETLDDVIENQRFADYLDSMDGVTAKLAGPNHLKLNGEKVMLDGQQVTTIFMDFNTSVLVELEKEKSKDYIAPLIKAIEKNILVNPRGMEPVGTKSVFEVVTGAFKDQLSKTTVARTPWTRKFHQRATTGPNNEPIENLIKWTRDNWQEIILKPEHGWSGKGIIIGPQEKDIKGNIKKALEAGNYIIQKMIPKELWSEMMPYINQKQKKVVLAERQTDFRCLACHKGLIGFVARWGGIPTNVGSGGGVQALAVVKSNHSPGQATKLINEALLSLNYEQAMKVRKIIDDGAMAMKFIYLNGPIPIGLRPRLLSQEQIEALDEYANNLYQDTLVLEKAWLDGQLDQIVEISDREKEIARMQPRGPNSPAMIATDGLFNFGAGLQD